MEVLDSSIIIIYRATYIRTKIKTLNFRTYTKSYIVCVNKWVSVSTSIQVCVLQNPFILTSSTLLSLTPSPLLSLPLFLCLTCHYDSGSLPPKFSGRISTEPTTCITLFRYSTNLLTCHGNVRASVKVLVSINETRRLQKLYIFI